MSKDPSRDKWRNHCQMMRPAEAMAMLLTADGRRRWACESCREKIRAGQKAARERINVKA